MKNVSKEELLKFINDHTWHEAAINYGVARSTIGRVLKKWNVGYYDYKHPELLKQLSPLQLEVVNGTMLGDAHIKKKYSSYRFKQCLKNEEYVNHIHNILIPFSKSIVKTLEKKPNNINGKVVNIDFWNGEYLEAVYFDTYSVDIFKNLRNIWYPEGKKIVPKDLELTTKMLFYWFLDDGCNNPLKKTCSLHTDGFTKEDVEFLAEQIRNFNIRCTVQRKKNNHIIAISSHSYFDFIDFIKPYCTIECMKYKFDTSKAPITRPGWGTDKLNFEKAERIRILYDTNEYKMKDLAKMFDVSAASIARVINNQTYKKFTAINIHGSAQAEIKLNYQAELRHGNKEP